MPGKSKLMIEATKAAMAAGKSVIIMTNNQAAAIERYSHEMPGVLFEVKGDHAIVPHKRKRKRAGQPL